MSWRRKLLQEYQSRQELGPLLAVRLRGFIGESNTPFVRDQIQRTVKDWCAEFNRPELEVSFDGDSVNIRTAGPVATMRADLDRLAALVRRLPARAGETRAQYRGRVLVSWLIQEELKVRRMP